MKGNRGFISGKCLEIGKKKKGKAGEGLEKDEECKGWE